MRRQSLILIALFVCSWLPLMAAGSPRPDREAAEASVSFVRPQPSFMLGLRDEAAMLLVGSALIGLAAAVRRSA